MARGKSFTFSHIIHSHSHTHKREGVKIRHQNGSSLLQTDKLATKIDTNLLNIGKSFFQYGLVIQYLIIIQHHMRNLASHFSFQQFEDILCC